MVDASSFRSIRAGWSSAGVAVSSAAVSSKDVT